MPVYEYECENCGTRFDRIQSMNDEPVRQCPECAGAVHKVFHAAGIIFKGSGWYITDSRKSTSGAVTGESKPAGGDKKSDGGNGKPSGDSTKAAEPAGKSDAKSESKADSKSKSGDG
jgi:putative FmdB family regulatory protein